MNDAAQADSLEIAFPNLKSTNYAVISPYDPSYNCIAFAFADTSHWWQQYHVKPHYWPEWIADDDTLDSWIKVAALFGFRDASNSDPEPELDKIAIYAKGEEPQHICFRSGNGLWKSKLGEDVDVEHEALHALEGNIYGVVRICLSRPAM